MYKTPENIKVRPLDHAKVLKRIYLHIPEKKNIQYNICDFAILMLTNVAMNHDCVYEILSRRLNEKTGKTTIYFDIPIQKSYKTRKGWKKKITPDFYLSLPVREIELKLCKKPITMLEYMGDRYNYNPRITENMKALLSDLNPAPWDLETKK